MSRRSREDAPSVVPPDRLLLELDGPGLEPSTVKTATLLELAAAFFALVEANAEMQEKSLDLVGLEVFNKCVAIAAKPSDLRFAREMAELSRRQIGGSEELPRGTKERVDRARNAMRRLAPGEVARVQIATWSRPLKAIEQDVAPPLDSLLSIRARPIRIGGKQPIIRFESRLEEDFSLQTDQTTARKLGPYLYREIEIEAKVSRDLDGTIATGRLMNFEPLDEDVDPQRVWRDWYRAVNDPEKGRLDG
ncbi:hypothetical protein [Nannocystis bainbridge]|uniref:Uncharacterized protein n=1 Tax=Nannocystis bainbridge TaxID=2995303 RepID=A0ABT5EAA9_9BACT|nr:hypothetical protein [Nannocystis bainbridge]MDC0722550.1 hypothetical protein [Nannocystis bainbridge]